MMLASADARTPVRSLLEMQRDKVVVQEWDLSCGAAALATILKFQHGEDVTEREIAKAMIARQEYLENPDLVQIRQGFSLLDLKRYVATRGLKGVGYGQLNFEHLVGRAPIIVPVSTNGYNHFVIFRGTAGDRVLLSDPAFGKVTMPAERFEREWISFDDIGRVGFVVQNPDGPPMLNDLAPQLSDFLLLRAAP